MTQGLVSVFLRERLCVSIIWGANLRGFEEPEVDSIGWGSECNVLSKPAVRECLRVDSSIGWGSGFGFFGEGGEWGGMIAFVIIEDENESEIELKMKNENE